MAKFLYVLLFPLLVLLPIPVLPIALVRRFLPGRHRDMDFPYLLAQTSCRVLTACFYRPRVRGLDAIPLHGGALLIANHVSYADVFLLIAITPRPIRFMSWEGFEKNPFTRLAMRSCGTIPVSPARAKEAIKRACERIERGEMVLIFPEGQLTRTGALNAFRTGYEMVARKTGAPVYPVYLDGLWGSVFSHHDGGPFTAARLRMPRHVAVFYGNRLADVDVFTARTALLDLGADAFAIRPELNRNLARATLRYAARHPGKVALVDRASGRSELSFARTHALARVFAKRLRTLAPERRVGVILPPGIPGMVVNLACVMAGKIPVNLNYTLGRTALEECFVRSQVRTVLTVAAFRAKLDEKLDIPWPARTVDVLAELRGVSKLAVVGNELCVRLLPASLTAALWRLPRTGGDEEASLLFTSGSSGAPKGVGLSHRNVLANVEQIRTSGIVPHDGRLLSNLPIFHSFGHTVSIWYALAYGCRNICYPSPLDVKRNVEVIAEEGANTLIGTPTFYRGYLKKPDPQATRTLQRIVAGAEKTPAGFAEECEAKLGGGYYEGYGATETSPVISVCVPDTPDAEAPGGVRRGRKPGSVGRLAVGQSVRILDPNTGEPVGFDTPGLLSIRGANVFGGYLNAPARTAEVLRDGWYATGDLVRMDEEGFLFIEGRHSRFSKLAGEMVPHGAIEEALVRALAQSADAELALAVSARLCPRKGEELVLLTTLDLDAETVRRHLSDAGLPNLWIPKVIRRVEKIPVLNTGKLDLYAIKELAKDA